jgi:hypothetical protein
MTRQRHIRFAKCGLLFLSLVLASPARGQLAPPPAGPPPAEAPPGQPGAALAPGYPPSAYTPPIYPAPGYSPPPGHPDPAPSAPARARGAETHDGLYLRLQLGYGYTRMSASTKGTDLSIAGGGGGFDIALGAALNPHLIIYGTLIESVARNPTYKLNGPSTTDNPSGTIAGLVSVGGFGSAGVVGVGGGLATYLPSNLFFAGSLLASRLFVDDRYGNNAGNTDWGFTFDGQLGKEWWVSDNWGLGVAGQLLLGAMKDHPFTNESVPTWYLAAFSVLFSASYN